MYVCTGDDDDEISLGRDLSTLSLTDGSMKLSVNEDAGTGSSEVVGVYACSLLLILIDVGESVFTGASVVTGTSDTGAIDTEDSSDVIEVDACVVPRLSKSECHKNPFKLRV